MDGQTVVGGEAWVSTDKPEASVSHPRRGFFDRVVLWLGLTLFLGVLPMTVAYFALPIGRSWEEILWRGDAFILTSALLGPELAELLRTSHRAKYTLICALLIIMVSCVSLFVAAVANYTASHPPEQTTVVSRSPAWPVGTRADTPPPPVSVPARPFGHLSDDMVTQFSFGFFIVGLVVVSVSIYVTHHSNREG